MKNKIELTIKKFVYRYYYNYDTINTFRNINWWTSINDRKRKINNRQPLLF